MTKRQQINKELKNEAAIIECAEQFGLVGDPTRMKICWLLCQHKELAVGEIADIIGVSISAVSHTLRKLKKADIVADRRDFRHVYYHLKQSPITKIIKASLEKI